MTNTGVVEKFIDLTGSGDIDKEAQTLLNDLRDRSLVDKIRPPNLAKYLILVKKDFSLACNQPFHQIIYYLNARIH
jgi:hypothetical protein